MTTTREYRSTDSGAPVLDGQVGSGAALLESVLFGVSGVAYGTGPTEKLAAGWSRPFTGTNKVVLRNSLAEGGTGYHFRFDDSGIGSGGAREMMIRAFSSMSDIDTGSDQMPLTSVHANGGAMRKSNTADSTARPWICIADELTCYLGIQTNTSSYSIFGFGDFESSVPGDNFCAFVAHGFTENAANNSAITHIGAVKFATPTVTRGLYLGRGYALTGDPVGFSIPSLGISTTAAQPATNSNIGAGGTNAPMASPSAGTALNYFCPAMVGSEGIIRGRLRGVFVPLNDFSGATNGAYESAPAGLPIGSRLTILRTSNNSGSDGSLGIESLLEW